MLIDELLIDCPDMGTDKIVKMVKEKESYNFLNTLTTPITYSIVKKGCSSFNSSVETGNIVASGNFIYTPEKDGEYRIDFLSTHPTDESLNKKETLILTHYPTLIKSVIKNTKEALCDDGCGCGGDCDSLANACLSYQNLFAETQLLLGLIRSMPNCEGKDVVKLFIYLAIDLYKCDLFSLFCEKELELKLKGEAEFSSKLTKKLIAINYLALYFYELWITNPLEEFVKYHEDKYRFRYIKDCLLKAGIDIFALQTIWDQLTTPCSEPPVCGPSCFTNSVTPDLHVYTFIVGTQLNGIYHTVTIKNNCSDSSMFIDRSIFLDDDFKVEVRNKSGTNPATVLPGGTLDLDIRFIGTKPQPSVINVPFKYKGQLINTYEIRFTNPDTPNRPPVIVDIIKELDNRDPYTFTVLDFESHFTDPDGDILDRIVIVGDTSRFTLFGLPYASGTEINRNNITSLVYTPLDTDDLYQLVLYWMAYDSYGLPSN
jgi:hypothetical protein